MLQQTHNLYDKIPSTLSEELFQTLLERGGVRIERIVSDGQATPPGKWFDQGWDEWVLLISGEATLRFETDNALCLLYTSDAADE